MTLLASSGFFTTPDAWGTGLVAGVLGFAAILLALSAIWKKGIKPLFNTPKRVRGQIEEWIDESPRLDRMEAWQIRADVRFEALDKKLTSIDRAVNHRGPNRPSLSHEAAISGVMLTKVSEQVERITEHLGLGPPSGNGQAPTGV